MEKQEGSLPLEPSLTDLILKPNSDKIRRPPNAFMIFAREQRKNLSDSHPDVSNKVISKMLGQMWKNTPNYVKENYFQKSQVLKDLHKSQYPDYIYSPREARLQKMKRKMKKDGMNQMDLGSIVKKEKPQKATKKETDRERTSPRDVLNVMPRLQYVPNNPHINDYFIPEQHGMDADDDNDPDQEMSDQCSSNPEFEQQDKTDEMPMQAGQEGFQENRCYDWSRTSERCGCCQQEQLDGRNGCGFPYKREVAFHFPSHPQHPYAIPPSLYGSSEHCPGILNPFCCGPSSSCNSPLPRSYESSIHPYWNPTMMNSGYLQSRDGLYGDTKPFRYLPRSYDFSRPPLGYFDRFASPMMNTSDSGIYPPVNESWGYLRRYRNEFISSNPELRPCRRNSPVSNVSNQNECISSDGKQKHQNWRVLTAYEQNTDPPHSLDNLEPITEEMANSSLCSQDESSANRLQIERELNNQEQSLNQNPEAMRMETSYISNFQNANTSDVSKHNTIKIEDRLAGLHSSNVEQARSENTIISSNHKDIPQFLSGNDYKNAYSKVCNARECPEKTIGNLLHVAPYGYTKSFIRNTENNTSLTNTTFQGTYYGYHKQQSDNESAVNSILKDTDPNHESLEHITEDGSTMPFTNIPEKKSNDTVFAIKLEDSVERETNVKNGAPQFHFYKPLSAKDNNSN